MNPDSVLRIEYEQVKLACSRDYKSLDATKAIITLKTLWKDWLAGRINPEGFSMLGYTAALAPCLAMELFDRQSSDVL